MSMKTTRRIYAAAWALHAPRVESPPGNLNFIRYPWVVSNEKLKSEIGWQPTADDARGVRRDDVREGARSDPPVGCAAR